jgi:hypothetical protein
VVFLPIPIIPIANVSFTATVYRVLIASPGDLQEERGIIEDVIHAWNAAHAKANGAVLLPVRWESHSIPEYGDRPQELLNRSIVHDCDLLVGAFWTRIGTPTGRFESGTVEEIEQFTKARKPVLLYFSSRHVDPNQVDLDQFRRLREFRAQFQKLALVDQFSSPSDLHIRLTRHLQEQARRLLGSIPIRPPEASAGADEARLRTGVDRPGSAVKAGTPLPPQAGSALSEGETNGELYERYWTAFAAFLFEKGSRLRSPTVREMNWIRFPMGSSSIRIFAFASVRERYIGVELALDRPECDQLVEHLKRRQDVIKAALGQYVDWVEHEGSYRIVQRQTGVDPARKDQWSQQHAWLLRQLEIFDTTFSKLIEDFRRSESFTDASLERLDEPRSATVVAVSNIPTANDLEGRSLTVAAEFRDTNPRRPGTHGWLAFEILRRAPGGSLPFEEYARRLFDPDSEIQALARAIPGQRNAYQHYKHIRCDIFRNAVKVNPPLADEWYRVQRCSSGANPYGTPHRTRAADP